MKAYPCSTFDEIDFRDEITITTESTRVLFEWRFRRQIRLRWQDFRQLWTPGEARNVERHGCQ